MIEKYLNKEFVMTKDDNRDFKTSTKCWICDNDYVNNDVNVRAHCHITCKWFSGMSVVQHIYILIATLN